MKDELFEERLPLDYFDDELSMALALAYKKHKYTEIRLKSFSPVYILSGKPLILDYNGEATENPQNPFYTSQFKIKEILLRMCHNSIYAVQNELCEGFLTLKYGHRVGVCGKVNRLDGKIISITDYSSLNIRISREIIGAADVVLPYIVVDNMPLNTLIISPPGCGKTTILRDLARQLAGGKYAFRTGIVDERNEITSVYRGKPYNDVGHLSDILSFCPKPEGIIMLLRGLNPEIIITDEIGTLQDENAILSTVNCGVKIICSAHGYDVEDVKRREGICRLIDSRVFERIIVLSNKNGIGTVEKII